MIDLSSRNIANEYVSWLKENIIPFDKFGQQAISTPFLDPFNDGIEVFLSKKNGKSILHDNGKTIDNLMDLGFEIGNSQHKKTVITHALSGFCVSLNGDRLEVEFTKSDMAQKLHFLIMSITRLNDLWMTVSPRTSSDFFDVVRKFFDENQVRYTANKSIDGNTVSHAIDFIIPLLMGRERLIRILPNPSIQSAKLASFSWMDLKDKHNKCEKIVILNDDQDTTSKTKKSEVMSILEGYSDYVFNWTSSVNDEDFKKKITAA